MKTLFDTDVRYAKAVASGVVWKLDGGKSYYRYASHQAWAPRMGGYSFEDEPAFNSWIASGLVKEVPNEDAV